MEYIHLGNRNWTLDRSQTCKLLMARVYENNH
ncbi:unnamed protein product [Schistosoma curassoni]|uniref:Uncharacterized protein n=1 Tax=Schistosoma curassoni TaxID=6186 RepID=A0A183KCE9_9TREM|nr:unnamed protein product [Schistosoma curassoni]